MARNVVLNLTPLQARTVNEALAYLATMAEDEDDRNKERLIDRTRDKVAAAMAFAGVRP